MAQSCAGSRRGRGGFSAPRARRARVYKDAGGAKERRRICTLAGSLAPPVYGYTVFLMSKRIGILTGGGDVPGLNSVIKTVVYRAGEIGGDVIGIRRGWEGLTHVHLEDPASRSRYILPLNRENTRTIDRTGGTCLHSSRTNPAKMKKLPPGFENVQFP